MPSSNLSNFSTITKNYLPIIYCYYEHIIHTYSKYTRYDHKRTNNGALKIPHIYTYIMRPHLKPCTNSVLSLICLHWSLVRSVSQHILKNQKTRGVLGGENWRPFYRRASNKILSDKLHIQRGAFGGGGGAPTSPPWAGLCPPTCLAQDWQRRNVRTYARIRYLLNYRGGRCTGWEAVVAPARAHWWHVCQF